MISVDGTEVDEAVGPTLYLQDLEVVTFEQRDILQRPHPIAASGSDQRFFGLQFQKFQWVAAVGVVLMVETVDAVCAVATGFRQLTR